MVFFSSTAASPSQRFQKRVRWARSDMMVKSLFPSSRSRENLCPSATGAAARDGRFCGHLSFCFAAVSQRLIQVLWRKGKTLTHRKQDPCGGGRGEGWYSLASPTAASKLLAWAYSQHLPYTRYALPMVTLQQWENTFVLGLFLLCQPMLVPGGISAVLAVQVCWQYKAGRLRGSKENKPWTILFGDQILIL